MKDVTQRTYFYGPLQSSDSVLCIYTEPLIEWISQ